MGYEQERSNGPITSLLLFPSVADDAMAWDTSCATPTKSIRFLGVHGHTTTSFMTAIASISKAALFSSLPSNWAAGMCFRRMVATSCTLGGMCVRVYVVRGVC